MHAHLHPYDPFTERLYALFEGDYDGLWEPGERDQLLADLLLAEAEELTAGIRHITIIHGTGAGQQGTIDHFFDLLTAGLATSPPPFLRYGMCPGQLTISVAAGEDTEGWLSYIAALAYASNSTWTVTHTPVVPFSRPTSDAPLNGRTDHEPTRHQRSRETDGVGAEDRLGPP